MVSDPTKNAIPEIWIVSSARNAQFVFEKQGLNNRPKTVREYRISTIGRYLISPEPLNVKRWLAGCEIHWRPSVWTRLKTHFLKLLRKKSPKDKDISILRPDFPNSKINTDDEKLGHHIQILQNKLRSFDSFPGTLNNIDIDRVVDVIGINEDDAGKKFQFRINGDTIQKLDYVRNYAGRKIDVRFKRAQFAEGSFEMSGYDFSQYNPEVAFTLLQFVEDGVLKACVLNNDNTIAFWIDDPKLINYLQLFELSVQQNHHMRDSLCHCIKGNMTPLRLMFNTALEIDYSQAPLPNIFKEMIGEISPSDHVSRLIKKNLNLYQVGVSLDTYSHQAPGVNGLHTDISVLQNLRALEPIKQQLPKLFAAMTQRTNRSDAGFFYLLDAIHGVNHEA